MRGLTGLLSDEVQLFVHLLLDEADLILLLLGDICLAWIKYIHGLEIECTDTAHEGFLQVLLHLCLHPVALVDLSLGVIQAPPQHLDLLTIVRTDVLDLRLHRLLKVLFLLLFSPHHMGFDPSLPKSSHSLLFVMGQTMS